MHNVQLILIEADSAEDAFSKIHSQLEGEVSWSDWNEITYENALNKNFAGRWQGDIFLTPEQKKLASIGELDKDEVPDFLRYADNQELADEVVSMFLGYRKSHIDELRTSIGTLDLDDLIAQYNPSTTHIISEGSMQLWRVSRLAEMLGDEWNSESAIYDAEMGTTSLHYFYKRCLTKPEKQFIVPADFHH